MTAFSSPEIASLAREAEQRQAASDHAESVCDCTAPLVGIVIVNWNGWQDTLRCLDSLSSLHYTRWKAIVVDNASSDESLVKLRPLHGLIELIESPINTGWAGGNNLGMRQAFELGCEYVWLLNNDAVAAPDALESLVEAARSNPDVAFIGSLIDHDPPRETFQFAGARNDPKSGIPHGIGDARRADFNAMDTLLETGYVMGCSLLTSRSVVARIGYIDERYFLNFDETDWCRRAERQGMRSLLVSRPLVQHRCSASIGGASRPLNEYFMIRNRLIYAYTHCTRQQRRRAWKATLWDIAGYARIEGHCHWLLACLRPNTPLVRTALIAVRDFLLGRGGDCPATVRRLHARTSRPAIN